MDEILEQVGPSIYKALKKYLLNEWREKSFNIKWMVFLNVKFNSIQNMLKVL